MKRTKMLVCVLLALVLSLTALPVAADDGVDTATFMVAGSVYARTEIVDGTVTLPAKPTVIAGFVGWKAELASGTLFLPAGASCTGLSGDVTFEPVTVSFTTDEGCSVRLREEQVALRFTSTLNRADYENLVALLGDRSKVMLGTYIVPLDYVVDAGGHFTLQALASVGYTKYIDVPATGFYKLTDATATIAGSVGRIRKGNYVLEYTGVGYMKLTYSDGTVQTHYAGYNHEKNKASILRTVLAAYNDRDESYGNLVIESTGSTHSPYTDTQLALCRSFLDSVVMVGMDGEYRYFPYQKGYYTSPWQIEYAKDKYDRNIIYATPPAGKMADSAMGVFLDGLPISLNWTYIENGRLCFRQNDHITVGPSQ